MENDKNTVKRGRGRPINETRREEIVETAGRLFGELGLHATTMEQIAKALKISKLTLYSRFADKEALFSAVIESKCQGHISEDLFKLEDGQPFEAALHGIAFALMDLLTSEGPMNMERMLTSHTGKEKRNLTQLYYQAGPTRVKSAITLYLQSLHEEQKLSVPNPIFSANLFTAMIKGSDICLRALMDIPPPISEQEKADYCREAVQMFIAAHMMPCT